jgi:hypothetical protein
MKLGIALPNNWGVMDPLDIVDIAVRAEEMGREVLPHFNH